jgi:hypothetical protein
MQPMGDAKHAFSTLRCEQSMYSLRASFIVVQRAALLSEVVACMESFVAGSDAEVNAALAAKREASVCANHALPSVVFAFRSHDVR